jgi:hypothetical protein
MSILYIILAIAICGLVLWLINTYLPMDPRFKKILNIVAIIALIIWLLKVFGVWGALASTHI